MFTVPIVRTNEGNWSVVVREYTISVVTLKAVSMHGSTVKGLIIEIKELEAT